jgi:hypothetical protein
MTGKFFWRDAPTNSRGIPLPTLGHEFQGRPCVGQRSRCPTPLGRGSQCSPHKRGEHPGDMEVTRAWQVMSSIHNYIATHKDADGHFDIKHDKTGEMLPLDFVEIHQPVRHLKKEGEYFVCTDFRKPGSKDEYYEIDFLVDQKSGKLQVDNVKIHKVPVQEDGIWTQQPRYTFEGMDFDVTN